MCLCCYAVCLPLPPCPLLLLLCVLLPPALLCLLPACAIRIYFCIEFLK